MSNLRQAAQQALEAYDQHEPLAVVMDDLRVALAEPTTCSWHGDEEGAYETSCKHIFQMIDGTPQQNYFTHCCFCGKALVQHLWEDGNDE